MSTRPEAGRGTIAFAERLLTLLDEGGFTATYKYAVLLALMDLCLEQATRSGAAPTSVTTEQLAGKVIELYWSHALPFIEPQAGRGRVLLQNRPSRGRVGQAAIVSAIARFRAKHAPDPSAPLVRARSTPHYGRLAREVEWKLVQMPLPRVQTIGHDEVAFIYRINWDRSIRRSQFNDRRRFDNTIRFIGAAGEHLVRLTGLLRPLIQRQWAAMVARFNELPDARLEAFLFGASRTAMVAVRGPLGELQGGRCFYCDGRLSGELEVDHFVPWARYPNDALANLVAADARCNHDKRDHLAAAAHVERWTERNQRHAVALAELADELGWSRGSSRSLSVARAIYLRLPDRAQLWAGRKRFAPLDRSAIASALG